MRLVEGWWIPDERPMADDRHPVHSQAEDVKQIPFALGFIPGRRLAIQAGARVGLWPKMLAPHFNVVLAFEPDPRNFECAEINCFEQRNVKLIHAALGPSTGSVELALSPQSDGESYVVDGNAKAEGPTSTVIQVSIDALDLEHIDAIFLDCEGYELRILEGAMRTLGKFKPTLILEENALCHRYGRERWAVGRFLKRWGYGLVAQWSTLPQRLRNDKFFRGADLIYCA
jgi:FkbM family methyltransferase